MTVRLTNNTYGYKGTARIVGILYIIGTLAGALSASFLSVRNEPDYLAKIAGSPGSLVTGAILVLAMGFALALIPVFMFPVLRKHSEAAALGYLVFRGALETCTYIISVVCYLGLASLGMAYAAGTDPAQLLGAGGALNAVVDSSVTAFAFGAGALIFYTALFRYRLIPRWLSGFGIIAVLLHVASGVLVLLGMQENFDTGSLAMNMPIAVQEMVLAVWLIAKGIRVGEPKG
ncbi:MAG: DUF4386 domain-containing protein [Clostridiales bacterium]|nr:DUF4386 domain-containing protein [Clostridiales bacterium]